MFGRHKHQWSKWEEYDSNAMVRKMWDFQYSKFFYVRFTAIYLKSICECGDIKFMTRETPEKPATYQDWCNRKC